MRFRVREAQVESPRARGSRADGKGWDRLSLSPGKLGLPAGEGSWRAGEWAELGQLWTLFMAETGELSRPGEPFLVLCPQNFLSSSFSQLGKPT